MNRAKEFWKTIIHTPWRMDEWIFWIVIGVMSGLFLSLLSWVSYILNQLYDATYKN